MSRRILRSCFSIAVCALLFACMAPHATQAAEKWLRLSSENFDMLSCTSEREAKNLLVRLEQFRTAFFTFFPQKRTHYTRPYIVVLGSQKQFIPYLPSYKQKVRTNLTGVFMQSPTNPRIMMVNEEVDEGLQTIFHEYVHSLIAAMGLRPPLYLNEGLAEVYSTFEVKGDTVKIGVAQPWYVHLLSRKRWLPFKTFFAVDHKSKYYNEKDHVNIFYAQSWLLMHYMVFGNNSDLVTAKKLDVFLDLCETPGISTSDAFERAFGLDYAKLEEALRDYLSRGRHITVTKKIPAAPIRRKITAKPADPIERDIELAGFKWRIKQAPDAEFRLLQLLEQHPANPRICEILAEIKAYEGGMGAAGEYWLKAVKNNSVNPLVYVWLLRSFYQNSNLPLKYIMHGDMCAEYRKLIDRALELAPDSMDAYELLAMIESQSPNIRAKEMNKVLSALPAMRERSRTYLALAVTYWRLKQYESAETVIKVLSADPKATHEQKRMAREVLREVARETGKEIPPPLPQENPRREFKIQPAPFGG